MRFTDQVLIFDADDTLWENNVRFERVIEHFLDWLEHPTRDRGTIRAVLDDVEAANSVAHGYGARVFLRSLGECLERLTERPVTDEERRRLDDLANDLLDHRVDLVPGVSETLDELGTRHQLILLTKGDAPEQEGKLEASGLRPHFRSVHVVPEKDVGTYRSLVRDLSLPLTATWMVGNSPRSDVLPARRAGMRAVFLPNDNTWVLEHTDIDPRDTGVLTLQAFPDLLRYF
ncbi:MAG TPA: HAD family hydrolase [Jiangellales bacterium]|nr:HAD family hydrolase [Jiangellales bacterium]